MALAMYSARGPFKAAASGGDIADDIASANWSADIARNMSPACSRSVWAESSNCWNVPPTGDTIGRVQGLVVDPSDHHVTHVLLAEGHLWGEKEVAIPISAVTGVDENGAQLNLTKDEVRDLPPVDIDHPA
jgi:hypothetical protein